MKSKQHPIQVRFGKTRIFGQQVLGLYVGMRFWKRRGSIWDWDPWIGMYLYKYIHNPNIYTWNPNDLYFWRSTLQNKAQTPIKTGVIWVPGIYIWIMYILVFIYLGSVHGESTNYIPLTTIDRDDLDQLSMASLRMASRGCFNMLECHVESLGKYKSLGIQSPSQNGSGT